jgi:membrane-associated protease RseP (regulator of RpoE activity)
MPRCALLLLLASGLIAADGYARGVAGLGIRHLHPVELPLQGPLGLQPGQGVQVGWVMPGSAAAAMGVQQGDVITAINGQRVDSGPALREAVWSFQAGDGAAVTVRRAGGAEQELIGTYGALPGFIAERIGTPELERRLDWRQRWWDYEVAAQRRQLAAAASARQELAARLDRLAAQVAAAEQAATQAAAATTDTAGGWRLRYAWRYDSAED